MHIRSQLVQLRGAVQKRLRNRRFWRDSGLLMLANVIVLALGMVRTPAMTWLLPKDQVGMMGVVAAWVPFLQLLSLSGLDTASYHYVAKGQPWAFRINLSYRLRWSLLSTVGFLAVASYWWWRGEIPLAWMFVITGISFPVTMGLTAAGGMLGAQEKFVGLFWYRLGESVTDFVGFVPILLSVWFVNQVVTFYGANQVATAVMQIIVSVWLLKQLRQSVTFLAPTDDAREMIRYGKHQTFISSISVVQSRTDALLIGTLFPLATVADYSIALLIFEQIRRLWSIYVTMRYPPLVRLPLLRRRRRLVAEGGVVWVGFIFLGISLAVISHWLIPIILPANYASSLGYVNWLIATVLIGLPGGVAEMYFRMAQSEKHQYIMRIVAAVVSVIAPITILLISNIGAYGVVIGRFVANFCFSVLGIVLFWRHKVEG
ncbi:MAG: oligosaccharide flippase family protein [Ardenticatenaceae bacterium]|nr:oligosaccharide flippase family protein [Ardenticatenaceae bacterium]